MTQEIKIPVSADMTGAKKAAGDMASAFDATANSLDKINRSAKGAKSSIIDLAHVTKDLRGLKATLEKESGGKVSEDDVLAFASGWRKLQTTRGNGTLGVRRFGTIDDWMVGHRDLYKDRNSAERHKRAMFAQAAQGTGLAGRFSQDEEDAPGGGGGGGGGSFDRGSGRAGRMAMGFGKSMLALAGIGSIVAMASKGVQLATEEAVGLDTLKRRMGDLGVDFERLRTQARSAGDGLGVTFVESMRLSRAYADEVGNLKAGDLANLGGKLHTAYGFGRSFGIDPETSVQFFGQMARYGAGRDEGSQRRLALLIGDAVARSGYGGQADEIIKAVANYTAMNARMTLTAGNPEAYLNAVTSLAGKAPGLDPANAASMIGQADSSVRRGGAMGDASKTFLYAMLRNRYPGINPVEAQTVMEGGLFATTESTFGGANNPVAKYMGKGVRRDNTTLFEMAIAGLKRSYGGSPWGKSMTVDAAANTFGVSHGQAAAMLDMQDRGLLGRSLSSLNAAGIDPMRLNATGFGMVSQLANAQGRGALNSTFGNIINQNGLSEAQRVELRRVQGSTKGMDDDEARKAMLAAVAKLNVSQESTEGEKTRQLLADMNDALTSAGKPLLMGVNAIRAAVVALAEKLVPGYVDSSNGRDKAPWAAGNPGVSSARELELRRPIEQAMMDRLMKGGLSREQAAAAVGRAVVESNLDPRARGDGGTALGVWQMHPNRWKSYVAWAKKQGRDPWDLDTQTDYLPFDTSANGTESQAGMIVRNAKNIKGAAAGMIDYERPGGYNRLMPWTYSKANGWADTLSNANRIAAESRPPAGAQPGTVVQHQVHGEATVNLKHPDGQTQRVKVPLSSAAGAPRPAGTQGGRAPLVRGHISF